jgi:hypothetical protein
MAQRQPLILPSRSPRCYRHAYACITLFCETDSHHCADTTDLKYFFLI